MYLFPQSGKPRRVKKYFVLGYFTDYWQTLKPKNDASSKLSVLALRFVQNNVLIFFSFVTYPGDFKSA